MLPHYLVKLEMPVVSRSCHWSIASVECVAEHWTKCHRRSDRSVACATHCLCTSKRRSFWAPDV